MLQKVLKFDLGAKVLNSIRMKKFMASACLVLVLSVSPCQASAEAPLWRKAAPPKGQPSKRYSPDRIILKFKDAAYFRGPSPAAQKVKVKIHKHFKKLGISVVKPLDKKKGVIEAIKELYESGLVEYAELDYELDIDLTPNDPQLGQLWGLHNIGQSGGTVDADIDALEAWDMNTGNQDIVVGVIDTGVDYNHGDLSGSMWTNPGEIPGNGRG